jgi:hypothetical protein
MSPNKVNTILVLCITFLSSVAALSGMLSSGKADIQQIESVRGRMIDLYGEGVYRHMSADVAIQGIAQDYVTFFVGLPLLLLGLYRYQRKSKKGAFLLAGSSGYFFVTYLFYTSMGMYNELFLVYAVLLGLSFFTLLNTLVSFDLPRIADDFKRGRTRQTTSIFLMVNSILIGLMWLGVVVPPLLDGTLYPEGLEHYTTLIVQGLDLGLLLPLSFVSGRLLLQKRRLGYLAGTTYIVFLAILMTALTAKVLAMMMNNVDVMPAIFIIPTINILSVVLAVALVSGYSDKKHHTLGG